MASDLPAPPREGGLTRTTQPTHLEVLGLVDDLVLHDGLWRQRGRHLHDFARVRHLNRHRYGMIAWRARFGHRHVVLLLHIPEAHDIPSHVPAAWAPPGVDQASERGSSVEGRGWAPQSFKACGDAARRILHMRDHLPGWRRDRHRHLDLHRSQLRDRMEVLLVDHLGVTSNLPGVAAVARMLAGPLPLPVLHPHIAIEGMGVDQDLSQPASSKLSWPTLRVITRAGGDGTGTGTLRSTGSAFTW